MYDQCHGKKTPKKETRGMYASQTKEIKTERSNPPSPLQKGNEKKTETRNTDARGQGKGGRRKEKRSARKSQVHAVHHQYWFIRWFGAAQWRTSHNSIGVGLQSAEFRDRSAIEAVASREIDR
jgi:hypothetical protein